MNTIDSLRNKNHFILIAFLLFQSVFCEAKQVTKEQSLNIAKQFCSEQQTYKVFKMKFATAPEFKLDYICTDAANALNGRSLAHSVIDSTAYYYVYNIGDNQGFIIVSGDDRTKPILGYSDEGVFSSENMPEHIKEFMNNYKTQIKAIMQRNDTTAIQKVMKVVASNDSAVAPLITTKWGQDAPYNSKIPIIAPTGCVATSMAQVMNYYKWPIKGISSLSYKYNGKTYSANFANTSYDWANMLNEYSSTSDTTSISSKAIATLMYHCGVSVKMQYDQNESGTYNTDITNALIQYFGYDKNIKYVAYDTTKYTPSQWKYRIKLEINDKRPVIIGGEDETEGHSYIADGYDKYNFIHLNWGWDGMYNGYYEIDPIDASTYFKPTSMIIGIKKPEVKDRTLYYKSNLGFNIGSSLTFTKNQSITTTSIGITEENSKDFSGQIRFAFYKRGRLYHILLTDSFNTTGAVVPKTYTFNIPDTLSVGLYQFIPMYKSKTDSIWSELKYYRPATYGVENLIMSENIEFIVSNTYVSAKSYTKTMVCKKGDFKKDFSYEDWLTVQQLVVRGEIDQWDLMYMASAKSIKTIDLKDAVIVRTEINTSDISYGGKPSDFSSFHWNLSSKWKNIKNYFWHGIVYKEGDSKWENIKGDYTFQGINYDPRTDTYYATYNYTPYKNSQIEVLSTSQQGILIGAKGLMADVFNGSGLENITLPTSLFYIAPMAFANCPNLKTVSLPDSVVLVGDSLFYNCPNLTSIKFSKKTNGIWAQSFNSLSSLNSVILPNSQTKIDDNTFSNCPNLNSIILPDSLKIIGNSAFSNCYSITSIALPDSLLTIGNDAFKNCSSLSSVILPEKLQSIGYNSFRNCSALKSIIIPSTVSSIGRLSFANCSTLASITEKRPNPVDFSSTDSIFYGVNNVACALYVPNGSKPLYYIANQWKDFTNLIEPKSVTINPGGLSAALTSIEKSTLTDITINGTMDARDFKVLRDSIPLLAILNLENVNIAAYSGTGGTYNNSSISYPEKTIPSFAFFNYYSGIKGYKKSLISIKLPETISSIDESSFQGCSGLRKITIPISVTSIKDNVFNGCTGISSIIIPATVTTFGSGIFAGCTGLKTLTISSGVASIAMSTFSGCTGLTNVTIPSTVLSLGNNAFASCSGLTSIVLSEGLTMIGENTFLNCSGISSLTIPSTVNTIGNNAFSNCIGLTSLNILNGVTTINGFNGCTGLKKVNIPMSVIKIEDYAFANCSGLSDITIQGNVKSIGNNAFNGSGLSSISLPEGVNYIGQHAFDYCFGLKSVTIPKSVISIGSYAFCNTYALRTVVAFSTIPADMNKSYHVFDVVNRNCILYVPFSSSTAYRNASQWKNLSSIVEMNGLKISTNSVLLPSSACKLDTLFISSNTSWIATTDQNWLTLERSSGFGNDTLALVATANTGSKRTAIVTVAPIDGASQSLVVTQSGIASEMNETSKDIINLYIKPIDNALLINGINGSGTLKLFDINGRQLLSKQISNNESVLISFLPQGLYIVKLMTSEGITERKIMNK